MSSAAAKSTRSVNELKEEKRDGQRFAPPLIRHAVRCLSPEPGASPARRVARALEHTLLRPDATAADIDRLCDEACAHGFHCVCVNGSRVVQAYARLQDTPVKVAATVAFPLGAMDLDCKRFETEAAIDEGAHEIDVVLNIGRFLDGDYAYVLRELRDVVEAADERP